MAASGPTARAPHSLWMCKATVDPVGQASVRTMAGQAVGSIFNPLSLLTWGPTNRGPHVPASPKSTSGVEVLGGRGNVHVSPALFSIYLKKNKRKKRKTKGRGFQTVYRLVFSHPEERGAHLPRACVVAGANASEETFHRAIRDVVHGARPGGRGERSHFRYVAQFMGVVERSQISSSDFSFSCLRIPAPFYSLLHPPPFCLAPPRFLFLALRHGYVDPLKRAAQRAGCVDARFWIWIHFVSD